MYNLKFKNGNAYKDAFYYGEIIERRRLSIDKYQLHIRAKDGINIFDYNLQDIKSKMNETAFKKWLKDFLENTKLAVCYTYLERFIEKRHINCNNQDRGFYEFFKIEKDGKTYYKREKIMNTGSWRRSSKSFAASMDATRWTSSENEFLCALRKFFRH
jgi:hypothetical protein